MAIDFPDSPSVGQTTVLGDKTWTWDGTVWNLVTSSGSDHGTLGGLEDDDHTHYLLADGSRSVSGSILPDTDVTYDLGSATYRFRDLYLSGNSIDLGGMVISYDGSSVSMVPDGGSAQVFATETYVDTAVSNLVDTAPETLDTLNELAAALGDDANFATTITSSIATKQDASTALTTSTTFGGDVSGTYNAIVVADDSHNHTIANVDNLQSSLDGKAASVHTHSYLSTSGGTVSGDLAVSGRFQIGGHYIDDVDGTGDPYGSINVGGAQAWDGYAIDQRVVFMHDGGSNWGIYNDVNNHWMVYGQLAGDVELRHNNTTRLTTSSAGVDINGRITASGQPCFYAYRSGSNPTHGAGWSIMSFNAELFDSGGNYNTSNYRFVAPVTGNYQFNTTLNVYNVDVSQNATQFVISLYKNGVEQTRLYQGAQYTTANQDRNRSGSAVMRMNTNDYAEIRVYSADTNYQLSAGQYWNSFSGFLIG